MKLKILIISYFLVAGAMVSTSSSGLALDPATKKVFLLGVDGLQHEFINKVATPNFDRLNIQKAYTGGIAGQQNEQLTSSGPSWVTIFTGVWSNKHGVDGNYSGLANKQFPSLLRRINQEKPNAKIASFSTWAPIHSQFFKDDLSVLVSEAQGGHDDDNFKLAQETLAGDSPDFMFLHLDEIDHAGHDKCFGPEYEKAIQRVDEQLGVLLDATETRQQMHNEAWLFLVVTDHGRDQQGCGHGEQTGTEKTIFIASNQTLNSEFSDISTLPTNESFEGLYAYPAQTRIAPTVLNYLDIDIEPEWLLDGDSLLGDTGIKKLMNGQSEKEFVWIYHKPGELIIKRNGQELARIDAMQQSWIDTAEKNGSRFDYTFTVDGKTAHYRIDEETELETFISSIDETLSQWIGFLRYKVFYI